jgi:sugar-specific transcriptional regulator TrmB
LSSLEHLVRLGLNHNEAKALDALIALGPSGAADVYRYAEMPRNKAYEALERLASRGIVDVQKGRPALYRSAGAKAVIEALTESYGNDAKKALKALEEKQEELSEERGADEDGDSTSAWMVKGESGVRRRLGELIFGAKADIFCVGGYPPKYLLTAKSALKAAAARGVVTRAVCMIRPTEDANEISRDDSSVIEFRTVKASGTLRVRLQPFDEKIVGGFAGMSGVGGMVIIDESVAFDIVDDGKDPKKVAGIIFKAPGIPSIQKATAERILALYTRKL